MFLFSLTFGGLPSFFCKALLSKYEEKKIKSLCLCDSFYSQLMWGVGSGKKVPGEKKNEER